MGAWGASDYEIKKRYTAQEMFEELGYVQYANNINYIVYGLSAGKCLARLTFNKNQKQLEIWAEQPMYNTLDLAELRAIHKQIEELRWED